MAAAAGRQRPRAAPDPLAGAPRIWCHHRSNSGAPSGLPAAAGLMQSKHIFADRDRDTRAGLPAAERPLREVGDHRGRSPPWTSATWQRIT